ncbi:hypothetical protein [Cytobacillus horneckiae]|uniref:hypothetical protein n=1 Tax=Cytobacillus horneckiae TaxID=549687 RepID=UPI003D1BD992
MKVEIKNEMIPLITEFVAELPLVRKHSRHRRELIKMLSEQYKKVDEQRIEIVKDYCEKDDKGKPIMKGETVQIPDENMKKYLEDVAELKNEVYVIEGGNSRELIRTMRTILLKFEDQEYQGKDSTTYDYLCEQFKVDENEEDE